MKTKKTLNWLLRSGFLVAVFIVVAVIAGSSLLFHWMSDSLTSNVTRTISVQYSQDLHAQMSTRIYQSVDEYYHHLDTMFSILPAIDNLNEEKLMDFLAKAQQRSDIPFLAFADDEGMVYTAEGSFLGTMSIKLLGRLLNGESRIVDDNETMNNQSLILFGTSYSEPVLMGEHKLYIAMIGIPNDTLAQEIALSNSYSGGYSSIIHQDGSFVVKNPATPYSGLNAYEILRDNDEATDEEIQRVREAVESNQNYLMDVKAKDGTVRVYLYFAPAEGTDWYIVNTMPGSFIGSSVSAIQSRLGTVSLIILTFILIVATVVLYLQASSAKKLKKSKEELAQALQTAEKASEAKTAFLFNMSHDIRTPMNAILGYTDIGLKHSEDRERVQDCFRKIMSSGGHLLSLINDILEMSRVESGKLKIIESHVDIRQSIANVDHISQSLAITKSIDYETLVGEIKNPYVYADELHVNEVMLNLVSNAVKYTPEGGKVRYAVTQLDESSSGKVRFRFEISDNGIGMSEEFQEHLFESFSREENATVSKIEGTGLGLSIVKKIVDLIGGTIHVKSKQQKGSTFTVELPFRVMEDADIQGFQTEKEERKKAPEAFSLRGKRVLLVEDNEMNREIATDILMDAELSVECAEDGEIALHTVEKKGIVYYDFILMDVQMPVMNGYEATKAIRALPHGEQVPIIALSANAFEEDVKKSIQCGMNAHIAKPIDIKTLLETLQDFVR